LAKDGKGEVGFAQDQEIRREKKRMVDRINRIYRMRKVGRSRRDRRAVEISAHPEGSPYLRPVGLRGFG
jgi:hypothetical protein